MDIKKSVVTAFSAASCCTRRFEKQSVSRLFFFRISILSLGLKNKCCTFRAAILFRTRRCICTTLKTRRFRSLSKRQTNRATQRGGGRRREYGRRCIRECIVPPILFAVKNKLPTARTSRAVYFFLLSHFLSARAAALVYGA